MLALNGLTRPVILHPGDKIAIRLGPDATPPTARAANLHRARG